MSKSNKQNIGVPCSKLKSYIDNTNIPCTSEEEAMAIAAGAWFTGKKYNIYMQNSGLGHTVDIVTSLYKPYEIPLPHLILSVRHTPEHHSYMFNVTYDLLDILEWDNYEQVIQKFSDKEDNKT